MIGVGTMVRPTLRTLANKVVEEMSATSVVGHSRPMHSAPVPINVRCYSNSDMIVRRSEVTLRATFRLMQRSKQQSVRSLCWRGPQPGMVGGRPRRLKIRDCAA